jgi:hypothetical protein
VFPFTLLHFGLLALLGWFHHRRHPGQTWRVNARPEDPDLPARVMLAATEVTATASYPLDVMIEVADGDVQLDRAFSVLMAVTGLGSILLYWQRDVLDGDLRLLEPHGARVDLERPTTSAAPRPLTLPPAAAREAETFIKRHAGDAFVVCLNLPGDWSCLATELPAALNAVMFVDLGHARTSCHNIVAVAGHGFGLHERLALARAADLYVGRFDELAVAALVAGRPIAVDRIPAGAVDMPSSAPIRVFGDRGDRSSADVAAFIRQHARALFDDDAPVLLP